MFRFAFDVRAEVLAFGRRSHESSVVLGGEVRVVVNSARALLVLELQRQRVGRGIVTVGMDLRGLARAQRDFRVWHVSYSLCLVVEKHSMSQP